jgi:integrase
MRDSTYRTSRRYFEKHWAALANRPVASITEAEVKTELRKIIDQRGKQAARVAKANLRAFYVWALREGIAKSNPTNATHALAPSLPRSRVLSDHEIRTIWAACGDDDFGHIIRLLFFTGCRRDEIGGLKWNELDLDTGIMTLPGPRTKSGRVLQLTLPVQAIEVLRQCPRKAGRDFLFGSRGGAFCRWGWEKVVIDRCITIAGHKFEKWSLHDIRRTVRTRLSQIGIAPHVAELVLGHTAHKIGVAAHYDHYSYDREIKEALEKWADALTAIVSPPVDKVVRLKKSA